MCRLPGAVRWVVLAFGALAVAGMFQAYGDEGQIGGALFMGLVYAGLAVLCFLAVARKRRPGWYRRM